MHLMNQLELLMNVIYLSIICANGQSVLTLIIMLWMDYWLFKKKIPTLSQLPKDSRSILEK